MSIDMSYVPVDVWSELNPGLEEAAAEWANKERFADLEKSPRTELQRLTQKLLGRYGPVTYAGSNCWYVDRYGMVCVFRGGGAVANCRACLEDEAIAVHNGVDDEERLMLIFDEFVERIALHRNRCGAVDKWVTSVLS